MAASEVEQPSLPGMPENSKRPIGARFHYTGKQVLYCGHHYADCVTTEAANRVAFAMNAMDIHENWREFSAQLL